MQEMLYPSKPPAMVIENPRNIDGGVPVMMVGHVETQGNGTAYEEQHGRPAPSQRHHKDLGVDGTAERKPRRKKRSKRVQP
jgi:hypothetical protein